MDSPVTAEHDDDDYIPFSVRFKAWWEGVDVQYLLRDGRKRPVANASIAVNEVPKREDLGEWSELRLQVLKQLWGEGFIYPGGAKQAVRLVKPMSLDPTKTVLDLTAGLGGGTRAMSEAFGLWISGMEPDRILAGKAHELSVVAGMEKKAPITHFEFESLDLPTGRYDGVLIRDRFWSFKDKEQILRKVDSSLKSKGGLILTDLVLKDFASSSSEAVQGWMEAEGEGCSPWTMDEYREMFSDVRMEARIMKEETEEYRNLILKGWSDFVDNLATEELDRDFVDMLMEEAKSWQRLVRALETGDLCYLRIHAINMGTKTLSDW